VLSGYVFNDITCHIKLCKKQAMAVTCYLFGRNTLLVPVFRGCFQFGPSDLISFDWVLVFLNRFQFYP
jgi:hypothetical protein